MLIAAGVTLPKTIFGHGWWTVEGKKMSKSVGNVVDPLALSDQYGVDPVRYFILREVPFGVDGDFSMDSFKTRYNADLANDLGNLLHRTLNMIEKYFDGVIPQSECLDFDEISKELKKKIEDLPQKFDESMNKLGYSEALTEIWALIGRANKYIEQEAPWKLAKDKASEDKLKAVLYNLAEVLKTVAIFVTPFIPGTGQKMWEQLNFPQPLEKLTSEEFSYAGMKIAGTKVKKGKPLFPRLEK
jgi:methionyl-tRNA synthetase